MEKSEILEKLFQYMAAQKVRNFVAEMNEHATNAGIEPAEFRQLVKPLLLEQIEKQL